MIESLRTQCPFEFLLQQTQSIILILLVQDGVVGITSMFQPVGWVEMRGMLVFS